MPFKAVAVALLVPPTSLVTVALIGLLVDRRFRLIGRMLTWFGLLGLLVLAMPAVSGTLLVALERNLPLTPPPNAPPQAIVILGGDAIRSGTETVSVHPGLLSLERIRAGAVLYRLTRLPVLITGGPLHAGEPPISAVMADSLIHDFQVPMKWTETESRDTWENAHLSAAILHQQGITSVYVVSQAWHIRRAILAFAGTGITVTAAPTRLDHAPTPILSDFIPESSSWHAAYYALHEWIGCAYYALR